MFSKNLTQLIESDIQALVDAGEKESSILEFKQEISGSDHEKKEIAKDVSAIANAGGGYLIVGINEQDGQAVTLVGTPKRIGRQPLEVWIENVLITNVRPKIAVKPKVIELTADPDRVAVVLYIPQSSRRPHMVVADGRNAYYVRHNYQSTFADEHEVRAMFMEAKGSEEETKLFLSSRKLDDATSEGFAHTSLGSLLAKSLRHSHHTRELPESFRGNPFVLFAACPRYLEERIDIASSDFRAWLDTNNRINLFGLNIDFLDYEKTVTADSIQSVKEMPIDDRGNSLPYRYVEIHRNAYVENGVSAELMWAHSEMGVMFQLTNFTAAFWLFMKFIHNLYDYIGYIDEVNIIVALVEVEKVTLHGFEKKDERTNWVEPYDVVYGVKPTCRQKNVRLERSVVASELNDERIEEIVKNVSKRISNAFGESISKCFDDAGNFNRDGLRGFRNVR